MNLLATSSESHRLAYNSDCESFESEVWRYCAL